MRLQVRVLPSAPHLPRSQPYTHGGRRRAARRDPGFFQLYPPNDRELTESLVRRAEAAGFAGIVVTLDTLALGWRPRDMTIASFPQLRGRVPRARRSRRTPTARRMRDAPPRASPAP